MRKSNGNTTIEADKGVCPYTGIDTTKPDPNIDWDAEDGMKQATRRYRANNSIGKVGSPSCQRPRKG